MVGWKVISISSNNTDRAAVAIVFSRFLLTWSTDFRAFITNYSNERPLSCSYSSFSLIVLCKSRTKKSRAYSIFI